MNFAIAKQKTPHDPQGVVSALQHSGRVSQMAKLADWLRELPQVGMPARPIMRRHRLICALLRALYLGLLLAAVLVFWYSPTPNIWVFCLPMAFIFSVIMAEKEIASRKLNSPQYLPQVVLPLIKLLKPDIDPKAKLWLRLDLRPIKQSVGFPCHTWMAGEIKRVDGTILRWRCTDKFFSKTKRKRTVTNKLKYKTKYKRRSSIEVTLLLPSAALPAEVAADLASVPASQLVNTKLKVKRGSERAAFRVRRTFRTLPAVNGVYPLGEDLEHILRMMSTVHDEVRISKQKGETR